MDLQAVNYHRFLEGDTEALAAIIRDCKDGLILYINTIVHDLVAAEELAEETFVKLVLKRPKYVSRASFKTWLYKIGHNLALNHLRRSKSKHVPLSDIPELVDEQVQLERSYIQKEEKQLLHHAMKKLKKEYQQVLWLIYFEGFTQKETAGIMRKSVHNVETLVYRARQALKTKLLEEGFEYENL